MLVEAAEQVVSVRRDWPDKQAPDIGFLRRLTKFKRATGWAPTVTVREGLGRAIEFYRKHLDRYIDSRDSRDSTDSRGVGQSQSPESV
jgi:nucleoside-diphosphate-sugar epimerase